MHPAARVACSRPAEGSLSHPNEALIDRFYRAFAERDAEGMASCYADDVHFSDPVFPDLRGEQARNMWRMLCKNGKDLRIEHRDVRADDREGSAHWDAYYTFSASGRYVHNVIEARFRFTNGRIVEHHDEFDFYRWSRQALGVPGVLLGWTPILRGKVRKLAGAQLAKFSAARREHE